MLTDSYNLVEKASGSFCHAYRPEELRESDSSASCECLDGCCICNSSTDEHIWGDAGVPGIPVALVQLYQQET